MNVCLAAPRHREQHWRLPRDKDSEPASGPSNMRSHSTSCVGLDNCSNPGSFKRTPCCFRFQFSSENVRDNQIRLHAHLCMITRLRRPLWQAIRDLFNRVFQLRNKNPQRRRTDYLCLIIPSLKAHASPPRLFLTPA